MNTQQEWLEHIQRAVDASPFKGYMKAEISKAGFVVVISTVSDLRWENRERAYPNSWQQLDELCHKAWLLFKRTMRVVSDDKILH